ncbi:MAG: hypothetical protein NZ746_07210, partial [Blastocatellia bacterium]|nr:hypothetical protein [Blastocatellia bacterium]
AKIGLAAVESLVKDDREGSTGVAKVAVEPLIRVLEGRDLINLVASGGPAALKLLLGKRVVHPSYGRGVIEKIYREQPPAFVVRFENPPDGKKLRVVPLKADTLELE